MKSNEELAREAAEALVTLRRYKLSDNFFLAVAGASLAGLFSDEAAARRHLAATRDAAAAAVLAAVEAALRRPAVPSELDAVRLAEIESWHHARGKYTRRFAAEAEAAVGDLLAEVRLLRRIIGDEDVPAAVVRAAYERGRVVGAAEAGDRVAQARYCPDQAQCPFAEGAP